MPNLWWRMIFQRQDTGERRLYLEGDVLPPVPVTPGNRVPRDLVVSDRSIGPDFDMIEHLPTEELIENGRTVHVVTIVVAEATELTGQ